MNHLTPLPDPDQVGSAEYRAIHELLDTAEDADEALAILETFRDHAVYLIQLIEAARTQPPTEHRHPRALDLNPHRHD